ncbi:MAG: transcriptional activator NhaR [Gammaproteobacteria bacterium]|nr:transcriptional activator NhaR [Gammaproteobacteria bacterium]
MRHPNYHHLLYFWAVVREGGIVAAAEALNVTPQTISGQIKRFEEASGGSLFEKRGRRLVPTELGENVIDYADDIFSRGMELARVLQTGETDGRRTVNVGIADAVPKLVAWRILQPLIQGDSPFKIVCQAGELNSLLPALATHRLDLVLSSAAVPSDTGIKAFSHLLGESDLAFFAARPLARKLRKNFPQSLNMAPFLMPSHRSSVRRVLDAWLAAKGLVPSIVGEFDDSALIKTFGQGGAGVFIAPATIETEITTELGVDCVGRTDEMRARFYVLSTEQSIKHPAIIKLTECGLTGAGH